MRSRWVSLGFAVCAVSSVLVAACSNSSAGSSTAATDVSSTADASTSTVAPTTTVSASTTTTAAATTTTTPPETTTTVPVGAAISLRSDGVGDALFGAEPESVIDYINGLLGAPTSDSGWVSAPERTCPGTEVRSLSWGDLSLLFGDQSTVSGGRRHFFNWSYGPARAGAIIVPAGMTTAAPGRIRVGSTVAQLRAAYPTAIISAGDEIVGPSATISDGLIAFLSNPTSSGVVISLVGGFGCGE